MEELNIFKSIISQARNVNNLPTLSELYKILENLEEMNIYDFDMETNCMLENWDCTEIILMDGTPVELSYGKTCILHPYKDFEKDYSYKIGNNLYICADCLTILVEHTDLCEKYYNCYLDNNLLFPKKWDRNSVISWIRKSEKKQEEYYAKRYNYKNYYDDYSNFNNIEDEDEEDYFSIEEFSSIHNEVNKFKEDREKIWHQEDCQNLYNRIINYVQNPSSLTKTQLNQAKDMSISAIQKNKEPNYEGFDKRVEKDREKALKNKKRKSKKIKDLIVSNENMCNQ